MNRKLSLVMATFVLLTALGLIAWVGSQRHASAAQAPNSANGEGKMVVIVIRKFRFEPTTVTVRAGDTVEWKNDDVVPHTATVDVEAHRPDFDSGTIRTGATWRYAAQLKGTYNYTCTFHPNMKGKLIVQ